MLRLSHGSQPPGCSLSGTWWALCTRCARGSGVSTLDYGLALEEQGAKIGLVFCMFFPDASYNSTVARFAEQWPGRVIVLPRSRRKELAFDFNAHLRKHSQITTMYYQTSGRPNCGEEPVQMLPQCTPGGKSGRLSKLAVRLGVHAVFNAEEPWGHAYARINRGISVEERGGWVNRVPVVPYIVRPLPRSKMGTGLRARLHIPRDATVFCSYGGRVVFDIPYVQRAVCGLGTGSNHPKLYFLFANHRPFCREPAKPQRVLHLPNLPTGQAKSNFIASCDAMLHGRKGGETFGLAVAEFSSSNKPVFTQEAHGTAKTGYETAHLLHLVWGSFLHAK